MAQPGERWVRLPVSDEDIIRLYQEGLSQNDIVRLYKASLPRTRAVLQAAGFDTKHYRQITALIKDTMQALSDSGATYYGIEEICDISFDVVREIAFDPKNKSKGKTKKTWMRRKNSEDIPRVMFPGRAEFADKFCSGASFCALCESMGLPMDVRVDLYWEIRNGTFQEADLQKHRAALYDLIRKDNNSGFSVTTIAKKHIISKSVVRKALDT